MRSVLVVLSVVAIGLLFGCHHAVVAPSSRRSLDLIARYHFVGGARLAADTNAIRLNELWALPASRALREETLNKLAKAPYELVKRRAVAGAPEHSGLIRPLLDDLLHAESFAELRGATNQTPELVCAIQLSDARAQVWSSNLSTVLSAWTGIRTRSIRVEGFEGWELRKHHAPNLFRFIRAGEWVVISCGQDQLPLQTEILQRIKSQTRPVPAARDYWLDAWTDWPHLSQWISISLPFTLPQTHLTVSGVGENVQTKISAAFSRPLEWKHEPWQVPTKFIGDSVVSFTAAQGIAPWLSNHKAVKDLEINPVPNQFCSWAESRTPFQTFLAVPTRDASDLFGHLAPRLMSVVDTNLQQRQLGRANWQTNNGGITLRGLPIIAPMLRPIQDVGLEFLTVGLVPLTAKENSLPKRLLSPIMERTNLVYYNWERTAERLPQVRFLTQAYRLILNQPHRPADSPGSQWLDVLASKLGAAVTEVTVTKPDELTLVRQSAIGFTAFELERLTDWLDNQAFPLLGYQLPSHAPGQAVKTPAAK